MMMAVLLPRSPRTEAGVHESPQDIARVQALLDASYRAAGAHLRGIHTERRRLTAADLVQRLQGMRLLVLATVSAAGRPVTGPVDGVFHRGAFHFGTGPDAIRWRHLRRNPAVSVTHLPSEDWAVIVHGTAIPADVSLRIPRGCGPPCSRCTRRGTGHSGRRSWTPGRSMPGFRRSGCSPSMSPQAHHSIPGTITPRPYPRGQRCPDATASNPSRGGSAVTPLVAGRRTSLDQSLREVMTAAGSGSGAHAEDDTDEGAARVGDGP